MKKREITIFCGLKIDIDISQKIRSLIQLHAIFQLCITHSYYIKNSMTQTFQMQKFPNEYIRYNGMLTLCL